MASSKQWDIQMDYSLTIVARLAAAISRAPGHLAGGPKGLLAALRKRTVVLVCIYSARLLSNDISVSFIWTQKLSHHFFRISAR